MRFSFRTGETLFLLLGILMVATSSFLLASGRSILSSEPKIKTDFFQSSYSGVVPQSQLQSINSATPAPSVSIVPASEPVAAITANATTTAPVIAPTTAAPTTATAVPTATPSREKTKVYLLSPQAHAALKTGGNPKTGYPVKFKFEIEPKTTTGTFELKFKNEIILSKPLSGSPNGLYEVSVMIQNPGLYLWTVTPENKKGDVEIREVIIRK